MRKASSARPCEVDGAVGVALAETALRLAHGFSGAAEVVHIALALTLLARLTLLFLAETAVLELFEQFVEAVAQGLLAVPQVAKRVALLSLMTLLPLSALRSALGAAPALILTLAEGAVAQILLPRGPAPNEKPNDFNNHNSRPGRQRKSQ